MKKNNIIEYSFRGKLDIDLLAENMRKDRTPIVIVVREDIDAPFLFISEKYKENYKGENLPLSPSSLMCCTGNPIHEYRELKGCYKMPDKTGLLSWRLAKSFINTGLENIKAIIKSHEDACLPKVKVIAVKTTAGWSNQ
ncbi:hypothetical protein LCGC14_2307920 [marine sediment metagenome]|uniref:Uncharacterized protein n=1 Tax=marine sediment metagenome TaxID=412755 RepID=A0A0F9EYU1_9ZZZZ